MTTSPNDPLRRWAAGRLGLPPDADAAAARDALLRRLPGVEFVPPESWRGAAREMAAKDLRRLRPRLAALAPVLLDALENWVEADAAVARGARRLNEAAAGQEQASSGGRGQTWSGVLIAFLILGVLRAIVATSSRSPEPRYNPPALQQPYGQLTAGLLRGHPSYRMNPDTGVTDPEEVLRRLSQEGAKPRVFPTWPWTTAPRPGGPP